MLMVGENLIGGESSRARSSEKKSAFGSFFYCFGLVFNFRQVCFLSLLLLLLLFKMYVNIEYDPVS